MMNASADTDLWGGAYWIWHAPVQKMHNFHLLARKAFSLLGDVKRATCLISANNAYELYINGNWVGRGPVRSYPEWQYYDEYDVSAALQSGDNVVAVHAYSHGGQHDGGLGQLPGPGGLIVKLTVGLTDGSAVTVGADDSWRVLRAPQYQIDAEHVTRHRQDFKEVYDAAREIADWREVQFDDSGWPPAAVLGPVPTEPFAHLIPRDIPFFTSEPVWPVNAFGHVSGCAYGFSEHDINNPEALRRDDGEVAEIFPLHDDFEVQIILDFGRPTVGRFHLDVADCGGGEIFISYGDSLDLTRTDRLILRPGPQHYQPYERRFGRYVMLTCRDLPGPLKLRGAWFELVTYPVQEQGEFACSDAMLNRIWDVGRWTLRMNMHDHYEDCPWREQTLYCGDLRVSALLAYYAYGDYALARNSLTKLARIQEGDGRIPNHGPVPHGFKVIPEYPALWLIALADYWQHSSDLSLVEELWGNVERLLEWYHSWGDERGLMKQLPTDKRSDFVDNLAGVKMDGQVLAVQALYHHALLSAAVLADAVSDETLARTLRERAQRLGAAINELYWDEELQAYVDCLTDAGEPASRCTPDVEPGGDTGTGLNQISNGLVLYCGLVPVERRAGTLAVLLDPGLAPPVRAGYMNYYVTEALFAAARPTEAVQRIRDYWGGMIERGATTFWEVFDTTTSRGELPDRLWSLCHEFCCGPVHSLPAHVLGVQPIRPGFARTRIAPEPGDLRWARGSIPTPRGPVEVCWQRADEGIGFELEVAWPAGMSVELAVPIYRPDAPQVYADEVAASFEKIAGKAILAFDATDAGQRHRIVTR